MGAIAGALMLDGSPVPRDVLDRLEAAVRNFAGERVGRAVHGPFGAVSGLRVIAAEDRLGQLPSRGSGLILAADIRLDNRCEVADWLALGVADAARLSDADMVRHLCAARGDEAFVPLVGDFACALYDQARGRLTLVRDHTGRRPVFHTRHDGMFLFASMPQILFALPDLPRALDVRNLSRFTMRDYADPEACLYAGITRLPPATMLTIDETGSHSRRYWSYDLSLRCDLPTDQDYVDRFMTLYRQAVGAQMRSEKPVGCFMSSGLDSTATTALAAGIAGPAPVFAYTAVPRATHEPMETARRYEDEGPLAAKVAARFVNLVWKRVPGGGLGLMEDMERLFYFSGYPVRNCLSRMWVESILRTARDDGVSVILDSSAGNQSVSWSGLDHLPTLMEQGRLGQLGREAWALMRHERRHRPSVLAQTILLPILSRHRLTLARRLMGRIKGRHWQRHTALRDAVAGTLLLNGRMADPMAPHAGERASLFWRRRRAHRLGGWSNNFAADYLYALEAAHGIALRDPTTDRRLVQFLLSIPTGQYLKDGIDRRLIRRAFTGLLPPEVVGNRRQGRQAADWGHDVIAARGLMAHEIERVGRSEIGDSILDGPRLRALLDAMPEDPGAIRGQALDYGVILPQAAAIARFVNWFEQRN